MRARKNLFIWWRWPKPKFVSVPSGPNESTSVLVRFSLIDVLGGTTRGDTDEDRQVLRFRIRFGQGLFLHWRPGSSIGFKKYAQPWERGRVWLLDFGLGYMYYSPIWVKKAQEVYVRRHKLRVAA